MKIEDLEAIVLDFDGVLTDNKVYVDQDGREMVCCNRSDGLAFDVLKKTKLHLFILSTEKNPVVLQRGKKLGIPVYQGINDKSLALNELSQKEGFSLSKTLFIGNDLNDYQAMIQCGYKACPKDSHFKIIEIASIHFESLGGEGVVRELVEDVLKIDLLNPSF
jgi:3-deoxy-D-manno-octulosonate 8-phosphate phosphatase (KDO 8-P phosphatase)